MVVNGWTIYTHPLFSKQLARLKAAVDRDEANTPADYLRKPNAKLLHAITTLALERIPQDPTLTRYRLGDTLGPEHRYWFRDKFGNGRFRLFFRYDSKAKIIVYAWINDDTTLRTYGSKTDAYAVFTAMLRDGNPPGNWAELLAACKDPEAIEQMDALLKKGGD